MARVLNIIAKIIELSKEAKKQLEKGKISSAKRIFELILNFNQMQLYRIHRESNSQRLTKECVEIYKLAETAKKELEEYNLGNNKLESSLRLLDKIIKLEEIELGHITTKNGLAKEIIETLDPLIKELVDEINKLSFVKRTRHSCSGHFILIDKAERLLNHFFSHPSPYITIIYDKTSQSSYNILKFHRALKALKWMRCDTQKDFVRGERRFIYYLANFFPIGTSYSHEILYYDKEQADNIKTELVRRWKVIERIVAKFKDYDRLEIKRQKELVNRNIDLLNKSPKGYVHCPRCNRFAEQGVDNKDICYACEQYEEMEREGEIKSWDEL